MTAIPEDAPARKRPTLVRHHVLWLTVLAYMITYMDRVVISTAAPYIREEFGLTTAKMGWVLAAFQLAYALFQVPGGWLGDRFGPRRALTGVVAWWSLFTAATVLSWNMTSLIVFRFLFGMGEAGAFPIATRSLSRWILPAERGWAQGVTHAGSRAGGAITPFIVAALIGWWGWRAPFVIFALVGLIWAAFWWVYYRDLPREHQGVNVEELALIEAELGVGDKTRRAVPWKQILSAPQMWLLSLTYFCYGWGIVTFLQWTPTYLHDARGFNLAAIGLAASAPLAAGVVGDLLGGFISDRLLHRTGNLTWARRIVMLLGFALAAFAVPLAAISPEPVIAVAWFALAVFGLELVVGVAWAITLDIGGDSAGSVSAVMNTFGNLAGTIAIIVTGYVASSNGWNSALFVIAGFAVIGALLSLKVDASRRIA
ncbi:MFS transporter [Sphingomonas sp.]|jgi:sugar phosphate permease|uniref:MFS transporter n=1 Tax=Sphingomonas sp. TaxID=28214 RepID=UPI002ED85CC4